MAKIKTSAAGHGRGAGHTHLIDIDVIQKNIPNLPPSAPGTPPPAPPVIVVPGAPTGVTITATGSGAVEIAWIPPANNGGGGLVSYTITVYNGGTPTNVFVNLGTSTSVRLTGLTNNDTYYATVAATNSAGTGPPSALSAGATPVATPATLLVIQVSTDNAAAELSGAGPDPAVWTLNYNAATTVGSGLIFKGWVAGDATGGTWTGPAGWTMVAPFSDGTDVTWLYAFLPPSANTVSIADTTNLVFTLNAGSALYGAGQLVELGNLTGGISVDGFYQTYVSGSASSVASPALTDLSGDTDLVIYTAGIFTSSGPDCSAASGPGLTAMGIWAGADGAPGFTLGKIVTGTPVGSVATETLSFTCTNVTGIGVSAIALSVTLGTQPPGTPPSAINTQATIEQVGNGEVTISWTAPYAGSSPITGYVITAFANGVQQTPVLTGSTATSYAVTGLTNGVSYEFSVAAINAVGTGAGSPLSEPGVPTGTGGGNTVPNAPTSVTAAASTSGSAEATVSWTAPSNGGSAITDYYIYEYINGVQQGSAIDTSSTTTSYTVTGLNVGTTYTFAVYAINAIGQGPASVQSTAVTPTSASAPVPGPTGQTFSSWSLATNGDWEFAQMASMTGPEFLASQSIWTAALQEQFITGGGASPSAASGISIVNGTGLVLLALSNNTGSGIWTKNTFTPDVPLYREIQCIFASSGGHNVNWSASWQLGNNSVGPEVDINEVGGGTISTNLHAQTGTSPSSSPHNYGVLNGTYRFGVYLTSTGVSIWWDAGNPAGAMIEISGSPFSWPGGNLTGTVALMLLHTTAYNGYSGDTVYPSATIPYTVVYDRTFVP